MRSRRTANGVRDVFSCVGRWRDKLVDFLARPKKVLQWSMSEAEIAVVNLRSRDCSSQCGLKPKLQWSMFEAVIAVANLRGQLH